MKKLLIALSLFLVSCAENKVTISTEEYNMLKSGKVPEYPKKIIIHNTKPGEIIKVDECEYIIYFSYQGTMSHKGNCRFCQKRSEETIRKIIQEELQKCK